MDKKTFRDSFVWWSSEESRAAGKVSVLAVVETVASVAGFWWLAHAFGLELLLLTSVILAFFVLLRSPQSIARGVVLLEGYLESEKDLTKAQRAWIVLLPTACAGAVAWWLATHWLNDYDGWSLFWRAASVGLLGFSIGLALTTATMGAATIAEAAVAAGTTATIVTVAVALAGAGALALALAGAGAGVDAVSIAAAGAGAIAIPIVVVKIRVGAVAETINFTLFVPGFALGIALRAIVVRFWATLCHFFRGLPCFAANWTTLALKTDWRTPPELIPGLPKYHELHFHQFFRLNCDGNPGENMAISFFALLLFYLPSVFYRYYLKSTAWLYFPLIWVAKTPGAFRDPETRALKWDSAAGRTLLDAIAALIAFGTIAFVFSMVLDWNALQTAFINIKTGSDLPIHPMLILTGLDFTKLNVWYWVPVTAALLTLAGLAWSNVWNVRVEHNPNRAPATWQVRGYLYVRNSVSALVIAWILVGVYEVGLAYHLDCQLPEAVRPVFDWLYGPRDCAAG